MTKSKKSAKGRSTKVSKKAATKPTTASAVDLSKVTTPAELRGALAKLGKTALQAKYKELMGEDAKSDNVHHLRQALAKKILPKPAKAATANGATKPARPAKEHDPRLPAVGTVIERVYKGVTHKVKVLADGFEYGREQHRSLSGIAKSITGQQTNGFLWFGLIPRAEKKTSAEPAAAKPAAAKSKKPAAATKKRAAKKAKG